MVLMFSRFAAGINKTPSVVAVALRELELSQVESVYSGKAGKCCCGCAGKHSYASAHVADASKRRGYAVTPDEVNDRQVKRVLGIVKERFDAEDPESYHWPTVRDGKVDGQAHYSAVVGGRLYVVYVVPSDRNVTL